MSLSFSLAALRCCTSKVRSIAMLRVNWHEKREAMKNVMQQKKIFSQRFSFRKLFIEPSLIWCWLMFWTWPSNDCKERSCIRNSRSSKRNWRFSEGRLRQSRIRFHKQWVCLAAASSIGLFQIISVDRAIEISATPQISFKVNFQMCFVRQSQVRIIFLLPRSHERS